MNLNWNNGKLNNDTIVRSLLEDDCIGQLWIENANMQFKYTENWLNNSQALPISKRLPLKAGALPPSDVKVFFSNLIPEGEIRKLLAKKYGISVHNTFNLLEKIGGECAGALSVRPPSLPVSEHSSYEELPNEELNSMIHKSPAVPLILGKDNIRLSLAGAQDKLPVFFKDHKIYLPLGEKISSHILKVPQRQWEDIVFNELFCMRLAQAVGLNIPHTDLYNTGKYHCFLIKRYDRIYENNILKRMHQEDFCQAFGLMPDQKYQKEGGRIHLQRCFEFLRNHSSTPGTDITQLILWVLFNFIIGNCDAHGKNLSLMIHKKGQQYLAPFYDILCTCVYDGLSLNLAMSIGGDDSLKTGDPARWKKFAEEAEVSCPFLKKKD